MRVRAKRRSAIIAEPNSASRASTSVEGSGTAEGLPFAVAPFTDGPAEIGSPLEPPALGGSELEELGAPEANGALGARDLASPKPLDAASVLQLLTCVGRADRRAQNL
ncbi:MAG TPA: hypothetical protein VGY55_13555 [Pirellulales bacterium]|nr:hypothetical protein [Pirellulales bacterium]